MSVTECDTLLECTTVPCDLCTMHRKGENGLESDSSRLRLLTMVPHLGQVLFDPDGRKCAAILFFCFFVGGKTLYMDLFPFANDEVKATFLFLLRYNTA